MAVRTAPKSAQSALWQARIDACYEQIEHFGACSLSQLYETLTGPGESWTRSQVDRAVDDLLWEDLLTARRSGGDVVLTVKDASG